MKALLLFQPVNQFPNLSDYLKHKSEQFYNSSINTITENNVHLIEEPVSIVPVSSQPKLPLFLQEKIREGEACLLSQLRPLIACDSEEVILSKEFSYLSQSFKGYNQGTVVFVYTTNCGTYYVLFPDIMVEELSKDLKLTQELVAIRDGENYLYPLPVKQPSLLANHDMANSSTYAITNFNLINANSFSFQFSVPNDPYNNKDWWGLYRGVMPGWDNLGDYIRYEYLSSKNDRHPSGSTITINNVELHSGCIYTFALFKWKWDLTDYIEFKVP